MMYRWVEIAYLRVYVWHLLEKSMNGPTIRMSSAELGIGYRTAADD
jgi:hypothetical protein